MNFKEIQAKDMQIAILSERESELELSRSMTHLNDKAAEIEEAEAVIADLKRCVVSSQLCEA